MNRWIKGPLTVATMLALTAATPTGAIGQDGLAGQWTGAIVLPAGSGSLDIEVTFGVEGGLSATIAVPSQGATGIPLTEVTQTGSSIGFVMATGAGPGRFVGDIVGDVIEGTFTQSGAEMAFRLDRGAAPSAGGGGAEASGTTTPHLLSAPAEGMDALSVGHAKVNGSHILPYEAEFTLTRRASDGSESPFGSWTDKVERTSIGGTDVLRREVARYTAAGDMDLWRVHTVDPATLAPRIVDQRFGAGLRSVIRMEHDGASIKQTMVAEPDRPAVVREFAVAEAPFDLSLYAVLLMGFPQEVGYQASFPVLGAAGTLGWETFKVEGGGEIALPGGDRVATRKVSTSFRTWSVWFEDEAPYIVRIVQRMPDGSEITSERAR